MGVKPGMWAPGEELHWGKDDGGGAGPTHVVRLGTGSLDRTPGGPARVDVPHRDLLHSKLSGRDRQMDRTWQGVLTAIYVRQIGSKKILENY